MTIYIPVSVEKELPPLSSICVVLIANTIEIMGQLYARLDGHEWMTLQFEKSTVIKGVTHWLKPIEVESLIEHVQNDVMADDIKEIISQSILKFLK